VKIHTSKSLKSQDDDECENYHYQLVDGEKYLLTDGEADWLFDWVKGKYEIASHLIDNIEETDQGYVYTIDSIGLGEALEADQMFPKAVMLSDDSTLQAVFFYSACEPSFLEC
jgi:proteasome assembly chaperone (PAC2) family protein